MPGKEPTAEGATAPITFSSFVVGLTTQALVFLGVVPAPEGSGLKKDAAQAAAIIAVLEMLAQKTKGNLEQQEAKLVEEALFELRTRYVEETRRERA